MGSILIALGDRFLVTLISRFCADEFKAWSPWLVQRLITAAVRKLPEGQQERYREEWSGHVADIPGEVGKLFTALDFLRAATVIRAEQPEEEPVVFVAHRMSTPYADRTRFGLLPEPESIPGAFLASCIINGVILAILIVLGTVAEHDLRARQNDVPKPAAPRILSQKL
jgi:hypothetical protein